MRVVGIDFGHRRIGIAVSDASGTLATPAMTLDAGRDGADRAALVGDAIASLERDDEPVGVVVVGWPRRLDGSANAQTPIVEAFAARLRQLSGRTVVLQDERLTSHHADQLLGVRERDWRVRKQKLDAASAAVILQEYLDAQARREEGDDQA